MQAKSKFRSRYEHTLDAKGRLSFPSRYRDVLRQYDSEVLMVTVWNNHLRAYPVPEWLDIEAKLLSQGKEQPGLASFVRLIVSGITEISLDKQGRLLLPVSLRGEASLTKDVVLSGMVDWVEIWDRDAWNQEHKAARENFASFEEKLSNLGIF